MEQVQDLKALEQRMESSSGQQRIDTLLKTLDYGDAALYLIIQALDDSSQLVRETAHLLLINNQSEQAKEALWNYLPYKHLKLLCTLHFLEPVNKKEYENWLYGRCATNQPEPEQMPVAYDCPFKIDYVAFSPNRDILVTYSDQEIRTYLWNYRTGVLQVELTVASWEDGGHVVLSPNGAYVISNNQHILEGYHLQRGDVVSDGYRLESEPTALAIKSEYTLIAGGGGVTSYGIEPIYVYQLPVTERAFNETWADPNLIHSLQGHTSRVQSLLLSPDEGLLLSQARDRQTDSHHLWETQTWQLLRTYETSSEWVADCLATRPDGQVLASGDRNGAATVWDLQTDVVLSVLPGKAPTVMSADGRVLVCCSNLGGLLVWDLATDQKICTLVEGTHEIKPLALSCDRQFLVICVENSIQVWA